VLPLTSVKSALASEPSGQLRARVNEGRTILVVDDEMDVVTALESGLKGQGYEIRQASRWTEAIAEIQDHRPDAVLLDLYLPNVQGEALLEFIRDLDAKLPVIIVSSEIEVSKLEQLGRLGANGFVRKPFSEDDLFLVVDPILSEAAQRQQAEKVQEPFQRRPSSKVQESCRAQASIGWKEIGRKLPRLLLDAVRQGGAATGGDAEEYAPTSSLFSFV